MVLLPVATDTVGDGPAVESAESFHAEPAGRATGNSLAAAALPAASGPALLALTPPAGAQPDQTAAASPMPLGVRDPSVVPERESPAYVEPSEHHLPDDEPPYEAAGDYELHLTSTTVSSVDTAVLNAEWSWLMGITSRATAAQVWPGPFQFPVAGTVTSPFGGIRRGEGLPNTPHLGVDLGARAGAPAVAANSGVVVFAGALEVRGNAVIIDHGRGVFSGYYHLSRIDVAAGQKVAGGTTVGATGGTGLSTGPHLHWDMVVLGKHTDPLTWVGQTTVPVLGQQPVATLTSGPQIASAPMYPTLRLSSVQADAEAAAAAAARAEAAAKAQAAAVKRADRAAAVIQLYLDLLGRDPAGDDQASLDYWTDSELRLEQIRQHLVLQASAERRRHVRQLYLDLLGRDPNGADDASVNAWAASNLTLRDLRAAIAADGAGERAMRVRALYVKLLGRDPAVDDIASLNAWVFSDLTIAQIQQRIMATDEYTRRAPGS